jgi:raffinose/stachyose/melibiose transport system substrate-binding protein
MSEKELKKSKFQSFGLILAGLFYILACVMVAMNTCSSDLLNPGMKTITFAHWQLEDGFREGYNEAIKLFEEYKLTQGERVKVIQTTVPFRGYGQWYLTQLLGGKPANVIELTGNSDMRNQYFRSLSEYIGKPNPFNKGTPFENVAWKATFHDGMNAALDPNFGEYFGIGAFSAVYRIYVNLDLLKQATGSEKMPETLEEWLDSCQKIRIFSQKIKKPVIPIGVRGFDKRTLNYLFSVYFSQTNGDLNDYAAFDCNPSPSNGDILKAALKDKNSKDKLLSAVSIVKDIGKNFSEGFPAMDLEQTKFLFFAGKIAFFPEGTWNAYSMVKNSPFKVGIMRIPLINKNSPRGKYFVGAPTEQGIGVGAQFGIPKAANNFKLSLEFLQFVTSWKINQMIMVDYCKWLPAVKKAKLKGLLKSCKPMSGPISKINLPFKLGAKSKRKMLETLERIIIENIQDSEHYFYEDFINELLPILREESRATIKSLQRNQINIEKLHSAFSIGQLRQQSSAEKARLEFRYLLNLENLVSNYKRINKMQRDIRLYNELAKLKETK